MTDGAAFITYWSGAILTLGYTLKTFGDLAPLAFLVAPIWPAYWIAHLGYWLAS